MTRFTRVLAVCGWSLWCFTSGSSSSAAQTVLPAPELRTLVERVMRDGVADIMSRQVADGVGLGRQELPYKAVVAPVVNGVHRDVAVIMVDGCSDARVDLCREIVFGHVSAADYWALRATPSADWSAGFVYQANKVRVDRPMTKEDGERKLAIEKAFWLAWLGRVG